MGKNLITDKPMNRADWAWMLAAVIVGLFVGGFAILADVSDSRPHLIPKYNFTTEKWEEHAYTKRLIVETNGDAQKINQAVHDADPDSYVRGFAAHQAEVPGGYCFDLFAGIFCTVLISFMFRIVVKICGRILGTKVDVAEIVRDPSTASGQAGLRSGLE